MSTDRIQLTGISGHGFHGVFDFEKKKGQPFIVDILVTTDFTAAAKTDDLIHTVDYSKLAKIAHEAITGPSFNLIEKLGICIR